VLYRNEGFSHDLSLRTGSGVWGLGSGKNRSDAGKNIPGSDARSNIRGIEACCARKNKALDACRLRRDAMH